MRVITANVNGIRSAARKGYFRWQRRQQADVVCLQEVRALPEQMPDEARAPRRYWAYFSPAVRKGYSGVALYARRPADQITTRLDWGFWDEEGRYLQADFGALSVISLYLPSGANEQRRQAKAEFRMRLLEHLRGLTADGRSYILCGDLNVAHKKIDLENWRANQKHPGFLPEERAWMDQIVEELGWVDAFRRFNPRPKEYTWWSNRGQAYAKNVGWRLDYQLVTPDLGPKVTGATIYRNRRFSDHAPVCLDYDIEFSGPGPEGTHPPT